MRVMHLIEPWTGVGLTGGTDAAVLACAATIAATPADQHETIAIGASIGRTRARRLGLAVIDGITPPGGADRAWQQLRAIALVRGCPDVVQPWSRATHRLAQRAAIAPVVSVPSGTDAIPQARPPQSQNPDRVRARLGVRGRVPVIAAIADPPGTVDAVRFVLLLGLLEQLGLGVAGVIEASAGSLARACVFARQVGLTQQVVITERPILSQTAGVDLAVWMPGERTTVDLWSAGAVVHACHGVGLPVLCPAAWAEALGDQRLADQLVCASGDPSSMLGALAPIIESRGGVEHLSRRVRASAASACDESVHSALHRRWTRAARAPGVT